MNQYAPRDHFHHSTPIPSGDSCEEGRDNGSKDEDSKENETLGGPPGQPITDEAGVAAANSDFNCHDCPRSEIACIRSQIRGIQLWSETLSDTGAMKDMLTRLREIAEFLDLLKEGPHEEEGGGDGDVDDRYLVKTIIETREEVVGIGLKAKNMAEMKKRNERLDLRVLEAMVRKFGEEMADGGGAE